MVDLQCSQPRDAATQQIRRQARSWSNLDDIIPEDCSTQDPWDNIALQFESPERRLADELMKEIQACTSTFALLGWGAPFKESLTISGDNPRRFAISRPISVFS